MSLTNAELMLRRYVAGELVDCWLDDKTIRAFAARIFQFSHGESTFESVSKLLGVRYLPLDMTVRRFVAVHYPALSEAMWSTAKRDRQIELARRCVGLRYRRTSPVVIAARNLDKKHDWSTVK